MKRRTTQFERELMENGLTIKTKKKHKMTILPKMQDIFSNAPVLTLALLHEKNNDDFICNDGKIKTIVTV